MFVNFLFHIFFLTGDLNSIVILHDKVFKRIHTSCWEVDMLKSILKELTEVIYIFHVIPYYNLKKKPAL